MDAPSATKLVSQLEAISTRYSKLHAIFGDFYAKSEGFLTAAGSPVPGLKFAPNLENNKFRVAFCGELFEFIFYLNSDQSGAVLCRLIEEDFDDDDDGPSVMGSFKFTGRAESDVTNDKDDPLRMDTPGDASHLVLSVIAERFK